MSNWIKSLGTSGAPDASWISVASDSTGTKLVAVINNTGSGTTGIWVSNDSGATWKQSTGTSGAPAAAWRSVASDSTGTKLVAVINNSTASGKSGIWVSNDSGATWKQSDAPAATWYSVASDSTKFIQKNVIATIHRIFFFLISNKYVHYINNQHIHV